MKGRSPRPVSVVEDNPFGSTEDVGSMSDGGYTCRICFEESADVSQLISPCQCKGTLTCSIPRTRKSLHHTHACHTVSKIKM